MLEVSALQRVKRYIAREDADGEFNLLALVKDSSISNTHVSVLIAHTAVDIKYALARASYGLSITQLTVLPFFPLAAVDRPKKRAQMLIS
jgi:hypothetical protein